MIDESHPASHPQNALPSHASIRKWRLIYPERCVYHHPSPLHWDALVTRLSRYVRTVRCEPESHGYTKIHIWWKPLRQRRTHV